MSVALLSSLIAVIGTLAGGLSAGMLQARVARSARHETRWDARQAEALSAVTALVAALADHRRAMWVREDLRLTGADHQAVTEARTASHGTRSAVMAPLAKVRILAPSLASPALQAAETSYALRGARNQETLAALRDGAIRATDQLIEAASQVFIVEPSGRGDQR